MEKHVADMMRRYRKGRLTGHKRDISKAVIDMKDKLGHKKKASENSVEKDNK